MMRTVMVMMLALGFAAPCFAADITQPAEAAPAKTEPLSTPENCAFFTNDCETCVVDADGKPSCSSTGIACVPAKTVCLIKKKAE